MPNALHIPLTEVDYEENRIQVGIPTAAQPTESTHPCHTAGTDLEEQIDIGNYSRQELFFRWNIYSKPHYIYESSFLTPEQFLVWKCFAWCWTSVIWPLTVHRMWPRFFVFLTNWNHTSIFIYLNLSFYICLRRYIAHAKSATDLTPSYSPNTTLLRFTYAIMQHSWAWTMLVVVVYWTTEFPKWLKNDPDSTDAFFNVCIHAITLVIIMTDLLLNKIEFVWPHVIYTLVVSILYLTVNGVYSGVAHTFVYQILKWDGPITAGAIVGCSFFLMSMYGLGHLLCSWRNKRSGNVAPENQLKWCVMRR